MRYLSIKRGDDPAYLAEIDAVLPRILALSDRDPLSPSFGVADRQWWAWKLIDFPNATFQGMAHGLAVLLARDRFADTLAVSSIIQRIQEAFEGTKRITRRSGHLEEALPYERSFCVTALVAYDLLRALEELDGKNIDTAEETIAPLIGALMASDETHGLISNHLATAAAALLIWHRLVGDLRAKQRGLMFLQRILTHHSPEGWFVEYAGADPGYQSLCIGYLVDVLRLTQDERLQKALHCSSKFLAHFAHPDGSFGGIYGSRATRLYYPYGSEALAETVPEAAALAKFMRRSIAEHRTIPLSAIDPPNLIPLFNNYARAASTPAIETDACVPCQTKCEMRRHFEGAGLLVDAGAKHYTIVSTHKGGVIYHTGTNGDMEIDSGVACRDGSGLIYTSQRLTSDNLITLDGDRLTIETSLTLLASPRPNLWNFLVLRLICATWMQIPALAEWIKRALAKLLIVGSGQSAGCVRRRIELGEKLQISDEIDSYSPLKLVELKRPFSVIHMASQGYWQSQDDRP